MRMRAVFIFDLIFAVLIKFVGRRSMSNLETYALARTGEICIDAQTKDLYVGL